MANVEHYTYPKAFITNSHCSGQKAGVTPSIYYQNTIGAGNRIGAEVLDPPTFTGGSCPVGDHCRWADASIIQLDDSVSWDLGFIARPTAVGSLTINGTNPQWVIEHADPNQFCIFGCNFAGATVNIVGRSSGWRQGTVGSVCANYYGAQPNPINFLCQMEASYTVLGGDSGAPVFACGVTACWDDASFPTIGIWGIQWGANTQPSYRAIFSPTVWIRRDLGNSGQSCYGILFMSGGFWC
jgi:hypothetical protein